MNYGAITYPDVNNGLGCRVTLFVSGCPHHCEGCHNPETWNEHFGKEYTVQTRNKLIQLLSPSYIKGLTISGGEPLYKPHREEIFNLVSKIKAVLPEKDIWIYTGYRIEDLIPIGEEIDKTTAIYQLLSHVDVLVDGRYMQNLRDTSLAFRGSSNQRIIDVKETLDKNKVVTLNL